MPHTMLNDQHWSKLETILRNFDIYLKRNLRNFVEATLWKLRPYTTWRDIPSSFVSGKLPTIAEGEVHDSQVANN